MGSTLETAFRQLLEAVVEEVFEKLTREREMLETASRKQASHLGDQLLLNSAETAKQLGISLATLERRTRSGEIPYIKLGRLVRYSKDTLKQWIHDSESSQSCKADTGAGTVKRRFTAKSQQRS